RYKNSAHCTKEQKSEASNRNHRRLRSKIHPQRQPENPWNTLRTNSQPYDRRNRLETRSLPTTTWRKSLQPTTQGELSSKHLGTEEPRSRTHHRNKRGWRDQSTTLTRRNRHPFRPSRYDKVPSRNIL